MPELKLWPPKLQFGKRGGAELSLRLVETDSAATLLIPNNTDRPYQRRQRFRCWSEVQVKGQGTRTALAG